MAEEIDSLLVKLGLEADRQQFQDADNLFSGLKTKALAFGAVIAGLGAGAFSMAKGFAEAKDKLGKFGAVYSTAPQFVDALGYALEHSGGQADDAYASIKRVADLIEQTQWGEIPSDAFRVAGFNPMLLQGVTSVAEAYERIADATSGMKAEDRRRALMSLGFDQAEITLFAGGSGNMKELFAEAQKLAPVTQEMIDNAAEFNEASTRMSKAMQGLSDEISNRLTPAFANLMSLVTKWVTENKIEVAEKVVDAVKGVPDYVTNGGPFGAMFDLYNKNIYGPLWEMFKGLDLPAPSFDGMGASSDPVLNPGPRGVTGSWADDETAPAFFPGMMNPITPMNEGFTAGVTGGWGPELPAPTSSTTIHQEYKINVDARGATDPKATEQAASRGIEKYMRQITENSIRDLREPAK